MKFKVLTLATMKTAFFWDVMPYSPDLSLCDFILFPKLKFYLKGRHFWMVENIKKAVTDQLKVIPVSDFQCCYEECLQRCVASQRNILKGTNSICSLKINRELY